MDIPFTYLFLLIILAVFLPVNGILSGKKIKQFFTDHPGSRMFFFKQTTVLQTVMTILVLGAMAFNNDSIDVIGLGFIREPIYILSLIMTGLLGWWLEHLMVTRYSQDMLRRDAKKDAAVLFIFPRTDEELKWAIGVSWTVGVCEEILFRGFLYWQLVQWVDVIPALLMTNLLFGIVHYATGLKNATLAFGLGILFSLIFLYTGSLWLPILMHILIDIYAMTKGRRYFESLPGAIN